MQPILWPSIWAAIAATFSAVSAISVLIIQRANRLDAARPELVLLDWSRRPFGNPAYGVEIIAFKTIKNVGGATAYRTVIHRPDEPEKYDMSGIFVAVLPSGESCDIEGEIFVHWTNVPDTFGMQFVACSPTIVAIDSLKRHHETRYRLLVQRAGLVTKTFKQTLTEGVTLRGLEMVTDPIWLLNFRQSASRIVRTVRGWFRLRSSAYATLPRSNSDGHSEG